MFLKIQIVRNKPPKTHIHVELQVILTKVCTEQKQWVTSIPEYLIFCLFVIVFRLTRGFFTHTETSPLLPSVQKWNYHYLFKRLCRGSNPIFPIRGERSTNWATVVVPVCLIIKLFSLDLSCCANIYTILYIWRHYLRLRKEEYTLKVYW